MNKILTDSEEAAKLLTKAEFESGVGLAIKRVESVTYAE